MRNVYKILVKRSQGKEPAERPSHKCRTVLKLDLKEMCCEDIKWT